MYVLIFFLALTSASFLLSQSKSPYEHYKNNNFSLFSTSTWHQYPLSSNTVRFNKEMWAWTSSFILKSTKPLKLTNLVLDWKGKKLDNVAAALYQKREHEALVPIEKNLVSQGHWDSKKQQMVFTLNEKIVAVNKYHLVVSYPKRLQNALKLGKFTVSDSSMNLIST
jgi:hypothetical protein